MTSTNVNIGFTESKNSSRVLKPPGGGHTDIFGIRGDNEVQSPAKKKNHPPTTITSCFNHEDITKPKTNSDNELKKKEDIQNGNQNGTETEFTDENVEPTKDSEEKKEQEEKVESKGVPPRRTRVPPGGFSSGLW